MATSYKRPNSMSQVSTKWPSKGPVGVTFRAAKAEAFHDMLIGERRRAERSHNPFLLMLLDAHRENGSGRGLLLEAIGVLAPSLRQTDALGWYKDGTVLGAIFTEIGEGDISTIKETLRSKVRAKLQQELGMEAATKIVITLHVFPQEWDANDKGWSADSTLYPDFQPRAPQKRFSRALKRALDIFVSGTSLLVLLPLFAAIAVAIKLTSKGPVLFRQERMGRFAKRFKFLKFRSMYVNNAPTIHQDYVRQFIAAGKSASKVESGAPAIYKITNDPRVTPIGRFLRKTSLDELPQLWNVLVGEMSLVGPRPPIPYEYADYQHWHRRRVLEVQPGITGLWQVNGRSLTTFDEMVRLDLHYATTWSLALDLKILLATPKAVFCSRGAY